MSQSLLKRGGIGPDVAIGLFGTAMVAASVLLGTAPRGDNPAFTPGHGDLLPWAYLWLVPSWIVCASLGIWSVRRLETWSQHFAWIFTVLIGLLLLSIGWLNKAPW